jgi:hypothetical protein
VFFWFAGMSFLLTWEVFRSPALDYRLVMLGAVLPVGEIVTGGPRALHSLTTAVLVLAIVMLTTRHRRLLRRQLLGLPIGLFMHLLLDGAWGRTELFWWPLFGWSFGPGGMPEVDRGLMSVLFEVVGIGALLFCYQRFSLDDPANRREFLHTGHITRDLVS